MTWLPQRRQWRKRYNGKAKVWAARRGETKEQSYRRCLPLCEQWLSEQETVRHTTSPDAALFERVVNWCDVELGAISRTNPTSAAASVLVAEVSARTTTRVESTASTTPSRRAVTVTPESRATCFSICLPTSFRETETDKS